MKRYAATLLAALLALPVYALEGKEPASEMQANVEATPKDIGKTSPTIESTVSSTFSTDQLKALLPGKRVTFETETYKFEYTLKPDNKIEGTAIRKDLGGHMPIPNYGTGVWRVTADARMCTKTTWGNNRPESCYPVAKSEDAASAYEWVGQRRVRFDLH